MGIAHSIDAGRRFNRVGAATLVVLLATAILTVAEQTTLQLDPSKTTVKFSLGAELHTVHGTFQANESALLFDPASGQVSGQILVDAKSGETGNGMRDRKMNHDVLESDRYPEISFRPTKIDGSVAKQGKSSVTIRGLINIHGADREITFPAQVEMDTDHWTAAAHFTVPYANWGMKNPSTFFLHVSDSVEIDLVTSGSVVRHTASSAP